MSSDEDDAYPIFIDFGLSKIFLAGEESSDKYGTLAFCSPEIIMGKTHNKNTDIWSLGIIIYILLSSTIPFLSKDKNRTKKNIAYETLKFSSQKWAQVSPDAIDLVSRMLEKRKLNRIDLESILNHKWLNLSDSL